MGKTANQPPNDKVDLYDALIKTNPNIIRKGATNPYTSVNGNMFTHLSPARLLALRLPKDAREAFLKKHATTLVTAYGIVLKEYVAVPDTLLQNTKALKKYLHVSFEYAKSLRPKPSKKEIVR